MAIADRIVSRYLTAGIENAAFSDSVKIVGAKVAAIFGFKVPGDVSWRTSETHPSEYLSDSKKTGKQDADGFVTADGKTVYLNEGKFDKTKTSYDEFVAHEIGHLLDKHLGGGSYFSETVKDLPPLKNTTREAFAMMVDYVVNEGHPGGPAQTALYRETLKKLGKDPDKLQ